MNYPHSSSLLTVALTLALPISAFAATIAPDGSDIGVTSINSGGANSLEYDFFSPTTSIGAYQNAPDLSNLTFATYTPDPTSMGSNTESDFSTLTIDGQAYQTGRYAYGAISSSQQTLGTITLGSSTPSSFILGIFTDNFGSPLNGTSFSLTITGGSTSADIAWNGNTVSNDFYNFSITGAQAGDIITIKGTSTFEPEIGGITFQTATVPEPSTYAMLGLGLVALAALRRRSMINS